MKPPAAAIPRGKNNAARLVYAPHRYLVDTGIPVPGIPVNNKSTGGWLLYTVPGIPFLGRPGLRGLTGR